MTSIPTTSPPQHSAPSSSLSLLSFSSLLLISVNYTVIATLHLTPFPAPFRPGTVKVVPEEGLPDVDHPGKKGSLLISFNISFPEKVSMEAAQQLRKLLP
mmetsp:Transcript_36223/g.94222  ORF Transcript_36223/g.94222 Transcript_36223/m.94222 type:complete len:100 (-) Transcript_36223:143-442(-)